MFEIKNGGRKVFLERIPGDLLTPLSIYLALEGLGRENTYILESAEQGGSRGRYSFIGSGKVWSGKSLGELETGLPKSPFVPRGADLPPFLSGYLGFLAYESIRQIEDVPVYDHPHPSVSMIEVKEQYIFDHLHDEVLLVTEAESESDAEVNLLAQKDALGENFQASGFSLDEDLVWNKGAADYKKMVEKGKAYIRAGDILQVVLSRRADAPYSGDPLSFYRNLRRTNPSPYMFYLKMDGRSIAGSSPELMVSLHGNQVGLSPIAGTTPRGQTVDEDKRNSDSLLADPKERAEHCMLVDLGRNDLGRVCESGSVKAENLLHLEYFSHVIHIVSDLRGVIRKGLTPLDVLRASFPAGTVTGAPKIRAMEIIHELEGEGRGIYSGSLGFIDRSGNLDHCIVLRTAIFENGRMSVQAGAGIVFDSNPGKELKETEKKAEALFRAAGLS